MNARFVVPLILGLVCLAALAATMVQRRQTAALQKEQKEWEVKVEAGRAATNQAASAESAAPAASGLSNDELLELMRLRSQVHQLRQRLQELGGVRRENETLRARAAEAPTNQPAAGLEFPPGYIRRKDVQFAGFGTPEAALQALLWAANNRDTNVLFRAAPWLAAEFARDPADFWSKAGMIPGFRLVETANRSDSDADLKVEIIPGKTDTIHVHKVGSEWQLQSF